MSSKIYPAFIGALARGIVQPSTNRFCAMLTLNYQPTDYDANAGDIVGEISGAGYQAGGMAVGLTVVDADRIILGGFRYELSSIAADGVVYYRQEDGLLVAFIDQGTIKRSLNGIWQIGESEIIIRAVPQT